MPLSPSPLAARRSRNAMSSRPPQTLSSRRAHTRRSHPRPRKSPSCSLLTITPAALRPRRHIGDPSATPNPHRSRPAKQRLFLPAVSSLRGFRTPAPRPVPARLQRAGVRNPSVKRTLRIAGVDGAIGRKGDLQGSPREGPECGPGARTLAPISLCCRTQQSMVGATSSE